MNKVEHHPTHQEVKDQIRDLVEGNFSDYEHARESLEDIIADLKTLRESLPSIKSYMDFNLL